MLIEQRDKLRAQMEAILDKAQGENRDLTTPEYHQFDALEKDFDSVRGRIDELVKFNDDLTNANSVLRNVGGLARTDARGGDFVYEATGKRAAVRPGESFRSHDVVAEYRESNEDFALAQYGNLGQLVRSLTTSGGSAVVPSVWAAQLIDLARVNSAVMQAGATLVPMDAGVVKIGRLTGDPTAAFRTEGSVITPSDPTFDNVTLTAQTMSCLVKGSLEWFQDADNADTIVKQAIAKAMAVKLDQVALYGGITTGSGAISLATPPNPRGVLAALLAVLPANVLPSSGAAANGTAQTAATFYGEVLDTIYKVRAGNEEPNAMLWNAKLARLYAGAADTTNQPLRAPADVEGLEKFVTNQIPSYTQGTMTNTATDLFVADWSQLLIGQRLGITIQVLTERYADTGEIGIVAHWRGDVQPARPAAFSVFRALKGA
ncbi:phage major capsid protein [Arthrobacter sp. H-02-3]|uniref:phage major capsid protein n=1 Tax=Arthrobacter sp. H-02-3 TaxID=2703675 RepID=UPI00137A4F4C|nr:phage major capsid protein [Arthrobacter sp. H-02-3]